MEEWPRLSRAIPYIFIAVTREVRRIHDKSLFSRTFGALKPSMSSSEPVVKQSKYLAVVQSLSRAQIFVTPWTIACQSPLSSSISHSLLKFMSIKSVRLSNHLIFCCPLLLFPSIFPSKRIFQSESAVCIRWPKYWSFSFSFSISCSNKYSGLTSWRID